ncbi:MAG TPA: response regulator [Thermoanaerobaculia bacterium]|nr:response regulator [Thermoanaerobaculia bacterium]
MKPSASIPLNTIPFPCWVHEWASDRLIDANRAAAERYGYTIEEFRKMSLHDLTVGDGLGGTVRHRAKSGEEFEVTLLANDLPDGAKDTRIVVAAPMPPREASCDFVDGSADIIYETEENGRFTFVNGAVQTVLGYKPAELIGRRFTELVRRDWQDAVIAHYRNQRDSATAATYYEFPAVAVDGKTVWFGQTVQRFVNRDGNIVFRAIGRDVTQRKFADERFNAFMNNSPAFAFIKQPEGRYVFVNDLMNRLFAQPGGTVLGMSDSDLLPPELATEVHDTDAEVVFSHRSVQVMESIPTVDGETRQFLVYKFPVNGPDGEIYIGGVAIDLSDRIKLERELAAARDAALVSARQKAQVLANMSHEIRTPMNGVLGMLGVLLDSKLDDDQRDLAETARSSAEALLAIINDILDFSKIEAGKLTFESLDFEVRTAVEGVLDLLSEAAKKKSLDIGYVLDPDIPQMLRGDAGRLRQILLNLIGNAVKFTETGGVLIQVERDAATDDTLVLRFRITDTGVGISETTRAHLFQPFNQADTSSSRSFGGTGLGLAISKQLVHMMDGDIGFESEPGCGSSFWFTAQFARSANCPNVAGQRMDGNQRVLIVEDSTTARHLVSFQLTAWGIANDCASDSATALDMLREAADAGAPYDVVISDLCIPDIDGVGLARIIKSNPRLGTPRIILMTGTSQKFDAAKLAEIGVTTLILKPIKQQHLMKAMFGNAQSQDAPVVPSGPKALPEPAVASHGRVLVVDDNVVNQKVTVRQLQKLGVAADAVGNGLEALEALHRIAYDLIFMDCQMPEMDGYETTAYIRQREHGLRRIPIVALTASAGQADRDRCIAAGMDDFVTKPVREKDLADAINQWMPKEGQRHERSVQLLSL